MRHVKTGKNRNSSETRCVCGTYAVELGGGAKKSAAPRYDIRRFVAKEGSMNDQDTTMVPAAVMTAGSGVASDHAQPAAAKPAVVGAPMRPVWTRSSWTRSWRRHWWILG